MNINNINELSLRQKQLYADLAAGMGLAEAATRQRYSKQHACRMARSAEGQAVIAQMRAEIEQLLAENLTGLVTQAIEIIRGQLASPLLERRVAAAQFVLRYVKPVELAVTFNDNATESEINAPDGEKNLNVIYSGHEAQNAVEAANFSQNGMEAESHESTRIV